MSYCYQQQLVLGFPEQDDRTFSTFFAGPNQPAFDHLEHFWEPQRGSGNIYLWGPPGCGRTHLLHALIQDSISNDRSAHYLDAAVLLDLQSQNPDDAGSFEPTLMNRIESLEGMDLICLDNIDLVSGHLHLEEALFHLYNRMHANSGRMVFSGPSAPRYLKIELQDLKSRLSHSIVYQLESLSDAEKCQAFQKRARERGIRLSDEVANYIMNRSQRRFSSLMALLDKLDKRSLVEKRRMTIPFVKEVLGW